MSDDELPGEIARTLLGRIGCAGDFSLTPIPGGRNNRVWRLSANDADFLLKRYYWSENDRRDRMGHEWDFLRYLRGIGSTAAPEPLTADSESRFALLHGGERRVLRRPLQRGVRAGDAGEIADAPQLRHGVLF